MSVTPPLNVSCETCKACCCRLEVILMGDDDVPARLTVEDHWGGWVMRRLDDGWCASLDRSTMKCTIYDRRPMICVEYQMGGSDCIEERSLFSAQRTPTGESVVAWRRGGGKVKENEIGVVHDDL